MNFETIADIYAAYDKNYEDFEKTVSGLTEDQENLPSENGKWTVGAIVEHIAKSETGMMNISLKLLSKAKDEGETSDGSANLSSSFLLAIKKSAEEKQKFEAPKTVHPEGGVSISESLKVLKQNRQKLGEMQSMFEAFDGTKHTFPHPAFGDMTAQDWLALLGGHIGRHNGQKKRILATN